MKYQSIGVIADKQKLAREAMKALTKRYDLVPLESLEDMPSLDAVVVLGGDGLMLHTLHHVIDQKIPVYGMNRGTIGFLMNEYMEENLLERLENAKATVIHPLKMRATDEEGQVHEALAVNEVSLLRKTGQAAKIAIKLDDTLHMKELVSDGVLVATPAGSSAYNFSVGGPILPIKSNLLALTPISPFRPRRWRGALLPHNTHVTFEVLKKHKRPVNAVADFYEVKNVVSVEVFEAREVKIRILFDPGHSLEERILREQFSS